MKKTFIGALALTIAIVGITLIMPAQTRPQPASASQPVTECPAPTSEGAYFVRGYDKQTGDVMCGFSFYNECPYAAAYSANDPMCDKLKEQQEPKPVAPVQPAPSTPAKQPNQCGGK